MAEVFNSKLFNGEVFGKYIERLPNPNRTELIKSRAIVQRPEIAAAMSEQTGGNYVTTPLKGLITGSAPQNYDGVTDATTESTKTFSHSRVVIGRMKSWVEDDFSYDITGGVDFMANIAEQVGEYWNEVDQNTIVKILNGLFKMSDEEGLKFVASHTYNITARNNSEGTLGCMDGTSLNSCMQKACGDNKGKFSLAIMHSAVATNLENLRLLNYLKYTDANGVQRDLSIATLNGRTVLIDDTMPVTTTEVTAATKGVYTFTISTAGKAGDIITVGGVSYTFGASTSWENKTIAVGTSATTQATQLKGLLATQYDGMFTVTNASGAITLTQVVGGTGNAPTVTVTKDAAGTIAVSAVSTTTQGVAQVVSTTYTTYVLGDGAIEYTDCGVKQAYEMDRNPAVHGGQDVLYSRQRHCYAPYGINFTKAVMASKSPTDTELEMGANWELVNDNAQGVKTYISSKAIPIARIISLG